MAILSEIIKSCENRVNRGFMADIFLSYAREDKDRVAPIVKELEKRRLSVFWDTQLLPGDSWLNDIEKNLNESSCVLVVWSRHSITSKWVKKEAAEGENRNILVPLRLDLVDPPFGFRDLHTADLSDWRNDTSHQAFRQIIEAITLKISSSTRQNITPTLASASSPEPIPTHVQADREHVVRQKTAASTTLKIGDYYGGGKVAWLDSTGKHGLIAAKADLPGGDKYTWEAAKKACKELNENGYNDWYLPSKDELNLFYINRIAIGGFAAHNYWSSTENGADYAWLQNFYSGDQNFNFNHEWRVRPVRNF